MAGPLGLLVETGRWAQLGTQIPPRLQALPPFYDLPLPMARAFCWWAVCGLFILVSTLAFRKVRGKSSVRGQWLFCTHILCSLRTVPLLLGAFILCRVLQERGDTRAQLGPGLHALTEGWSRPSGDRELWQTGLLWKVLEVGVVVQWALLASLPQSASGSSNMPSPLPQHPHDPRPSLPPPTSTPLLPELHMETAMALPAGGSSCLADEPWLGWTGTEAENNVWFYYQILE